jgi:hypothetical protein
MTKIKLLVGLIFVFNLALSQEEYENELEQLTMIDEQQIRDPVENTGLQTGIKYNLNTVTAEELSSLLLLTPQQIQDLIKHRNTYGNFLGLLELQVISSWDLKTIKQLLPFLYINNSKDKINVKHSIAEGKHTLMYRTGGKPNGFNSKDSWLTKNRQLLYYKFKYKDLFQVGDITDWDFNRFEYNTVIALEVFEHINGDIDAIKRIPKGTRLIFSLPTFDDAAHVRYFKKAHQITSRYLHLFTTLLPKWKYPAVSCAWCLPWPPKPALQEKGPRGQLGPLGSKH